MCAGLAKVRSVRVMRVVPPLCLSRTILEIRGGGGFVPGEPRVTECVKAVRQEL